MESRIGWIDLSPIHKDRVKKFLSMLKTGVTDELGVGMIRDHLSDLVYPGFSTLYTRAKYFFITPYILQDWMLEKNKKLNGEEYFSQKEEQVNETIIDYFKKHPEKDNESYFGKIKQNGQLQRQPSSIYWNGMTTLKFIDTPLSLSQILKEKAENPYEFLIEENNLHHQDMTCEEGEVRSRPLVNVRRISGWEKQLSKQGLVLSKDEANTLAERITAETPDSLTTGLIKSSELWKVYLDVAKWPRQTFNERMSNPFLEFVEKSYKDDIIKNHQLLENLLLAHDFSYYIHGAHICYNLGLRMSSNPKDKQINQLRKSGRQWFENIPSRILSGHSFNLHSCYSDTHIPEYTRIFLKNYESILQSDKSWDAIESSLIQLSIEQEKRNKQRKSRFRRMNDKEETSKIANELEGNDWIGLKMINYRYTATLNVLLDLFEEKDKYTPKFARI